MITSAPPLTVQDSMWTPPTPGPVRVVTIGDVVTNLCCGTHVSLGGRKGKRFNGKLNNSKKLSLVENIVKELIE